ncbi:Integrator complex subunit 13 [Nymphon striatum]|nr:Integrator complex subunit 13 [Nymphon striatum]
MTFPASHKTVYVLDRSPFFFNSFDETIEFESFTKSRPSGYIPLASVAKCLWTCTIEAVYEYCRIVWDIHPSGKLIRFIVSEDIPKSLNSWSENDQSLNKFMVSFAELGRPKGIKQESCNILDGLSSAVDALSEYSEIQREKYKTDEGETPVQNNGRIICITHIRNKTERKYIEEGFMNIFTESNSLTATDSIMPLKSCELVLINLVPNGQDSTMHDILPKSLSNLVTYELINANSGKNLAERLCHSVLDHYNLASTTVTGIPMKEEQNASSSAAYDVELFHPRDSHSELYKLGAAKAENIPLSAVNEGSLHSTVTLKWCTPRTSATELQHCTGVYRITTVDVNSRPSSCLTNFLLSGRAVMLEMPKKSGAKALSHMLASHAGEIFIHTLGTTSRSILEDPPSISEGCGGRVTDYRIKDLGEFMKENRLAPMTKYNPDDLPLNQAKMQLKRQTRSWPLVLSTSSIFNITAQLQPLLSIVTKEKLTSDEVIECKKVIYKLVHMESKNDSLPFIHVPGTRGKGPKREEQYRVVWNDLESYIQTYATSSDHQSILECIQECRRPSENDGSSKPIVKKMKLKGIEPDSVPSKLSENNESKSIGSLKKTQLLLDSKNKFGGPQSLLNLWKNSVNQEHSNRHIEFSGRQNCTGNFSKLYSNLTEKCIYTPKENSTDV